MKVSKQCNWVLAAVLLLWATAIFAQGPGRNPVGGGGGRAFFDSPNDPSHLLESESVQTELTLTDQQKADLQKIRDDLAARGQAFFRQFMGLSPDEMQKRMEERAKDTRQQIAKVLNPQQMARLNEINIQVAGAVALNFDDVAEKLALTVDQKETIKNLGDEAQRKTADLTAPFSGGQRPDAQQRQELQNKLKEVRAERTEKTMALLTGDQKLKFEQLQGQKFDTSTIKPARASFSDRGQIQGLIPAPVPAQ